MAFVISVVVPTYNERENIGALVSRTGAALEQTGEPFELIIVDDDSQDGTADEVRRLGAARPWLRIICRRNQRDLSTAVLAGWEAAQGDMLGCMDGDLQHPPEHVRLLLDRLREPSVQIAIASRYVEHGGVSDWKFHRRMISWTATQLVALLMPRRVREIRDPMSGFFLLKKSVIHGVALNPVGYKILLEVLGRGSFTKAVEVPYIFEERARGGSKMGFRQTAQFFLHLLRLRFS
jgi:dolichol-phosphate mannosyltransferase